jgi:hypothetical protein
MGRKWHPRDPRGEHYFLGLMYGCSLEGCSTKQGPHLQQPMLGLGRMHVAGFLDQLLEELLKFAEQIECIDGEWLSRWFFFQRSRKWRSD